MSAEHSKAFENMVADGDNDIVGLLAYALLKQNIREEALQGVVIEKAFRNPSPIVVAHYRGAAERVLNDFATHIIDGASHELQQSAVLNKLEAAEANITNIVKTSTGPLRAIWTNILAWLATGFIVFIIVLLIAANETAGKLYGRVVSGMEPSVNTITDSGHKSPSLE